MVGLIIQIIIILLICGFIYWAFQLIMSRVTFIAEPFKGWIYVAVLILIAAIVLFYAVIPLLQSIGHINFALSR